MKKIILNNARIDIKKIIEIAKGAGKKILEIYNKDFEITEKKSDSFDTGYSPLTEADIKSNQFIVKSLNNLYPDIPILSEEGGDISFEERKKWEYFWLIDPLDGTKDFIKRNGEFTVNIALIHKDNPILGVVYAPAKDTLYYADKINGSFKKVNRGNPQKLPLKKERGDVFVVVASKQHFDEETGKFIECLKKEHPNIELLSVGSSLKICMVAEGKADIYPRLGPTMEWDTAAAHAVVNFSGKKIYEFDANNELRYNKENLLNPWFIVK